ncbi:MAG: ABC transporter ATP-binding protein [Fulvivirga sp.]
MLEVKALSKQFEDTYAVKEISFNVPKGEVLVLLGTSGCGKTTTLKMINRLVEKTSGTITINGRNAYEVSPYELRRDIGYVIQETGLFPHYSVAQNIAVVPELLSWSRLKIDQRISELLDLIGLGESVMNRMPHELSGGQQQRVGLARALAADPSLILLDEPFGALDPITRKGMQDEFLQLEGALNKAMVLVTHDVNEAVKLGNQICLMDKGEVQQIGKPSELVFNPKNEFVENFFDQNRLELELSIVSLADLIVGLKPVNTTNSSSQVIAQTKLIDTQWDKSITFELDGKEYQVDNILETYYKNRNAIIKASYGVG